MKTEEKSEKKLKSILICFKYVFDREMNLRYGMSSMFCNKKISLKGRILDFIKYLGQGIFSFNFYN